MTTISNRTTDPSRNTAKSTTTAPPATQPERVDAELGSSAPAAPRDEREKAVRGLERALAAIDSSAFYVSDAKLDSLRNALAALSPEDYRISLDGLADRGDLDELMGSGEQRGAFLKLAEQKGYLHVKPGERPEARNPMPPNGPALYYNPPSLPPAMREAVHAENIARQKTYRAEYVEYAAAYQKAILEAPSMSSLRNLGAREPYNNADQPGVFHGDPLQPRWAREKPDAPSMTPAGSLVTDRVYRLQGKEPPGVSIYADGKVTVADIVGVSVKYKLDETGMHHDKESLSLKNPGGAGADFSASGVKASIPLGAGSLGLSEKGVDVKVGKGVSLVVGRSYDGLEHDLGIAIGESGEIFGTKVGIEGKLTMHTHLASKEEIAMFINPLSVGFFEKQPPEMMAGMSWKQLPENVRSFYADMHGWTEKEWAARMPIDRASLPIGR